MDAAPQRLDAELEHRVQRHLAAHVRTNVPLEGRRAAAVAVTLLADEEERPCFLLTRRAAKLRAHPGQWALPGGRVEPGESTTDTALRELAEEVGLHLGPEHVRGVLDDYPTRSGYVITPVLVWAADPPDLVPDPREVAGIYRVPLAVLERPGVPHLRTIPESDRPVISIHMLDTHVHAPTAAILYQLREVALHGRDTRVAHYEQPVFAWK